MDSTTIDDTAQMRDQMHGMWERVSPAWAQHADYVDARHRELTERLLDAVALHHPDRRIAKHARKARLKTQR